jgi:hypothetical protein
MTELPFRTAATELTLDQLLLLDFLAGPVQATIGLLYRDRYPIHMNVSYSHAVPDAALPTFLEKMVRDDLLATMPDESQPGTQLFALSRHGGDLWCKERLPVWQRYCFSLTFMDPADAMTVHCVDKDIGREFLSISKSLGYIPVLDDLDSVQWDAIPPDDLIDWHTLPSAWIATVRREPEEDMDWQRWQELEQQRTWWNDITELQKFVP